jgi:hypothetical protein
MDNASKLMMKADAACKDLIRNYGFIEAPLKDLHLALEKLDLAIFEGVRDIENDNQIRAARATDYNKYQTERTNESIRVREEQLEAHIGAKKGIFESLNAAYMHVINKKNIEVKNFQENEAKYLRNLKATNTMLRNIITKALLNRNLEPARYLGEVNDTFAAIQDMKHNNKELEAEWLEHVDIVEGWIAQYYSIEEENERLQDNAVKYREFIANQSSFIDKLPSWFTGKECRIMQQEAENARLNAQVELLVSQQTNNGAMITGLRNGLTTANILLASCQNGSNRNSLMSENQSLQRELARTQGKVQEQADKYDDFVSQSNM